MCHILKQKSEIFNSFFANQCSVIPNNIMLLPELKLLTEHNLMWLFWDWHSPNNSQDSNKTHAHDRISICMLKLCGEAICRPLNIIFKTCVNTVKFSSELKKDNVVLIHKKNDKRNVKIYRPVSLLIICDKVFERLIYNVMYNFLSDNNLLYPNQSELRSGDSCINQLLSNNHEILNAFYKGWEVRAMFLHIS